MSVFSVSETGIGVGGLGSLASSVASERSLRGDGGVAFAEKLAGEMSGLRGVVRGGVGEGEAKSGIDPAKMAEARKGAAEMIAAVFVQPILAEARSSMDEEGLFAPGPWEKQFGPLVDREIASSLVRGPGPNGEGGWPLVEHLAERFVGLGRVDGMGEAVVRIDREA